MPQSAARKELLAGSRTNAWVWINICYGFMDVRSIRTLSRTLAAVGAAACSLLLAGCAAVPDVSVAYRPVRWTVPVSVVHTITCNRNNDFAIIQRGVATSPIYSAAAEHEKFKIKLVELNGFFADSEIAVAFTDDGRLKSINQSTTGQAEPVVRSALNALAAISSVPTLAATDRAPSGIWLYSNDIPIQSKKAAEDRYRLCEVVRNFSTSALPQLLQVSLVQIAEIREEAMTPALKPTPDHESLHKALGELGLDFSPTIKSSLGSKELQPIADIKPVDTSSQVGLTLQKMVTLSISVEDSLALRYEKSLPVPTMNTFELPIPKSALFGKQSFVLSLSDSGRISTLGYSKSTGVPGAFNAATVLASGEVTQDNAEVAALKAAADLIAQQQRFIKCQLQPVDCK